jgi:hypothetical protein
VETTDTFESAVDSLLGPQHQEPQETADEALVVEEETDEAEVEAEAEADAEEVEASEEDVVDDDTETDDESETDEDEEENEDDKAPELYTVKVDGEEKQVTLDDLKRDYSGQAYIQKGMQEAAAARKEAESLFQTVQNEREQFFATLNQIQERGILNPPQKPDASLLQKDPFKYVAEKEAYETELAEYNYQTQMIANERQRHAALKAEAEVIALRQEAELLKSEIPELADPEKGESLKRSLFDTGVNLYGFSAEEMANIKDRRQIKALYDAYRWQQLQKGTQQAKKKPSAPKNVKPKPRRAEPQQLVRKRKMSEARKSGKIDDFVDFLLE